MVLLIKSAKGTTTISIVCKRTQYSLGYYTTSSDIFQQFYSQNWNYCFACGEGKIHPLFCTKPRRSDLWKRSNRSQKARRTQQVFIALRIRVWYDTVKTIGGEESLWFALRFWKMKRRCGKIWRGICGGIPGSTAPNFRSACLRTGTRSWRITARTGTSFYWMWRCPGWTA